MAKHAGTVNDLLAEQVGLDIECADRVHVNGYVPALQVFGQIVGFLTRHPGNLIPSPALIGHLS